MKTYKVIYHYGMSYFSYTEYVKGKDEDDARIKAQIILDNEDVRNLNIEKVIEVNNIYKEKGFNIREEKRRGKRK